MFKTTLRALRAMAGAAFLLLPSAVIAVGMVEGWGLGEWELAWGIGGVALMGLFVTALGGNVGPGYGRPAISGDEIGRPIG